ncbi:MAG: ketopantoate reductase family protein, partial [Vulcanimicrobiaceae bacterium]
MVGAGAIGAFIAGVLARSGVAVTAIARGEHLQAIACGGIAVESEIGDFTARLETAADLREVASVDIALLTFKAHQWPGFADQLAPLSGTGATIVTLQNGLPFWFEREMPLESVDPQGRIGAMFGDAQIVGGVVHSSAN